MSIDERVKQDLRNEIAELHALVHRAYGAVEYLYVGTLRGGVKAEDLERILKRTRDELYPWLAKAKEKLK